MSNEDYKGSNRDYRDLHGDSIEQRERRRDEKNDTIVQNFYSSFNAHESELIAILKQTKLFVYGSTGLTQNGRLIISQAGRTEDSAPRSKKYKELGMPGAKAEFRDVTRRNIYISAPLDEVRAFLNSPDVTALCDKINEVTAKFNAEEQHILISGSHSTMVSDIKRIQSEVNGVNKLMEFSSPEVATLIARVAADQVKGLLVPQVDPAQVALSPGKPAKPVKPEIPGRK